MRWKHFVLVAFSLAWCGVDSVPAADPHRLLVLDATQEYGSGDSRLLLVDVESGKIVETAKAGWQALIGHSPDGKVVGVVSHHVVGGGFEPKSRAAFYRADDLSLLQTGYLPVDRTPLMRSGGSFQFSPDGDEFVVQRMQSYLNADKPVRHTVDDCFLTTVKRELDEDGFFKVSGKTVKVPRCRSVVFLRVADWPRAHVWNYHLGALTLLDFSKGEVLSKLPIYDDPRLSVLEPGALERPNIGQLVLRLRFRGAVHTSDGRYAYYVPQQPSTNPPHRPPGFLRKVDLSVDPPKIVRQGGRAQQNLRAGAAAASAGGGLFVVKESQGPDGILLPSRQIQVFSTTDFTLLNELHHSLADCRGLVASHDGRYVYALSPREAKVAVIDASTGQEIRVLEDVGTYPITILALPESAPEE